MHASWKGLRAGWSVPLTGSLFLLACSSKVPRHASSLPLGAECHGYDECAAVPGLVVECGCDGQHAKPICFAEATLGEACSATRPCASGSTCVAIGADPGTTCHPLGNLGDPCVPSSTACQGQQPCIDGCKSPNYCTADGTCALADVDLGQHCDSLSPWSCRPPYNCTSSTCRAALMVGDPCPLTTALGDRSHCVDGAVCSVALRCVAVQPDGAPCSWHNECLSQVCFGGRCGRGSLPDDLDLACGQP